MTDSIELNLHMVKDVIDVMSGKEFSTGDVIRGYLGMFTSDLGTPAVHSYNAQFGKWLKRNQEALGIEEIENSVPTLDDEGNKTTNSRWRRT